MCSLFLTAVVTSIHTLQVFLLGLGQGSFFATCRGRGGGSSFVPIGRGRNGRGRTCPGKCRASVLNRNEASRLNWHSRRSKVVHFLCLFKLHGSLGDSIEFGFAWGKSAARLDDKERTKFLIDAKREAVDSIPIVFVEF